jgi:hypothetical protein
MKASLLVVLLLLPLFTSAQTADTIPRKDGRFYFSEVVSVDSNSKAAELYERGRRWVVDAYKSKDVVQLEDKESKELIVKGTFWVHWRAGILLIGIHIEHTLRLQFKDGRYRYEMSNFRVLPTAYTDESALEDYYEKPAYMGPKKHLPKFNTSFLEATSEIFTSLNQSMKEPSVKVDW